MTDSRISGGNVATLVTGAPESRIGGGYVSTLASITSIPSAYFTEVDADNPDAYFSFDEVEWGYIDDESGNNRGLMTSNNLTASDSLLVTGEGRSAFFNRTNAYGSMAYAAWMAVGSTFTMSCRIRPTSALIANNGCIAGRWTTTGHTIWLISVVGAKLDAFVVTSGTDRHVIGSTTLSADTNYTVAMRWDGSNVKVLLDGVVDGTASAPGTIAASTSAALEVGRAASSSTSGILWGGLIDELAIWNNAAISDARLLAHHEAADTPPVTTNEGFWGLRIN